MIKVRTLARMVVQAAILSHTFLCVAQGNQSMRNSSILVPHVIKLKEGLEEMKKRERERERERRRRRRRRRRSSATRAAQLTQCILCSLLSSCPSVWARWRERPLSWWWRWGRPDQKILPANITRLEMRWGLCCVIVDVWKRLRYFFTQGAWGEGDDHCTLLFRKTIPKCSLHIPAENSWMCMLNINSSKASSVELSIMFNFRQSNWFDLLAIKAPPT